MSSWTREIRVYLCAPGATTCKTPTPKSHVRGPRVLHSPLRKLLSQVSINTCGAWLQAAPPALCCRPQPSPAAAFSPRARTHTCHKAILHPPPLWRAPGRQGGDPRVSRYSSQHQGRILTKAQPKVKDPQPKASWQRLFCATKAAGERVPTQRPPGLQEPRGRGSVLPAEVPP